MVELLEFDVAEHEYSVEGEKMPGVTRVMASQFPLNVPKDRLEFARAMGRAIHSACELFDLDRLDFASVDHKVVPYLEAWQKFRKDTGCSIIHVEKRVWHPVLRYAGTLDRIMRMLDSLCVLDLKRPLLGPRVGVQLAAYQHAHNEWLRLYSLHADKAQQVTRRFGLQLKNDGNYRLKEYKDASDWSVFVACLSLFNWKAKHGE